MLIGSVAITAVLVVISVILYTQPLEKASGGDGPSLSQYGASKSLASEELKLAEEEAEQSTLSVSGNARLTSEPDKAEISVSVITESLSAFDSQQKNAQAAQAVRSAIAARGIAKDMITTSAYDLSPIQEWDQYGKVKTKGYRTTHTLLVKLSDINAVGGVIDAAAQAGANQIGSVQFGLSDQKLSGLRLQAISEAGKHAKEKAETLAKSLGVTLDGVQQASEGYADYQPVYPLAYASKESGAGIAAPTEISPGQVSVSASVNVVYRIK